MWLEWPDGWIRAAVVLIVAVTSIAALVGFPFAFKDRADAAARNSATSYSDREIAGGNGLVDDQRVVYEARARIPANATYRVAVGTGFRGGTDLTAPYVASWFQYFLMPRRPAQNARWIVCYGCDVAQYGTSAEVVWRGDDRIALVRIRR